MYQCPARCLQRLVAAPIEEIALAGGEEAFDAMTCVHFQHVAADHTLRGAPLPDGERSGRDIVGRAEMGADAAALGAKLLQLMRGQEAVQTFRNGLRFGVRLMLVAVPQSATGDRKVFVRRRYMHKTAVRQAGFRSMDDAAAAPPSNVARNFRRRM